MQIRRASSANRSYMVPLIGIACLLLHCMSHNKANYSPLFRNASSSKGELVPIYDLPSSFSNKQPVHLTPIDPSILVPIESRRIDTVHRNGYLHTGNILFIMDASDMVLFLQRSAEVVTCPSTWSVLGEHSNKNEEAMQTAIRGLEEELGFTSLGYEQQTDNKESWVAELRPDKSKDRLRVTIQNATEFPLYYIRHYGPRNENRIDSQLTYLWIVQFQKKHAEINWKLDDEVADHKWISLKEVQTWIVNDAAKHNKIFKSDGDVKDDGPDEGDFCHGTIRSLYEAGLKSML